MDTSSHDYLSHSPFFSGWYPFVLCAAFSHCLVVPYFLPLSHLFFSQASFSQFFDVKSTWFDSVFEHLLLTVQQTEKVTDDTYK